MPQYLQWDTAPSDYFPAWSPEQLFLAGGNNQLWFDANDIDTLFQDTAGAVPVTAAGQAVARINDKSGRPGGVNLAQATLALRPIYRVDGLGVGYLDFTGGNKYLAISANTPVKMLNSSGALMVHEPVSVTNARVLSLLPLNASDWNQAAGMGLYMGAAATGVGLIGGASGALNPTSPDKLTTKQYMDYRIEADADVYRNGVMVATDSGYTLNSLNTGRVAIGANFTNGAAGTPYFTGYFYSALVFDYVISESNRVKLREWCADRLGL